MNIAGMTQNGAREQVRGATGGDSYSGHVRLDFVPLPACPLAEALERTLVICA
jgi:hypothetical protein